MAEKKESIYNENRIVPTNNLNNFLYHNRRHRDEVSVGRAPITAGPNTKQIEFDEKINDDIVEKLENDLPFKEDEEQDNQ